MNSSPKIHRPDEREEITFGRRKFFFFGAILAAKPEIVAAEPLIPADATLAMVYRAQDEYKLVTSTPTKLLPMDAMYLVVDIAPEQIGQLHREFKAMRARLEQQGPTIHHLRHTNDGFVAKVWRPGA